MGREGEERSERWMGGKEGGGTNFLPPHKLGEEREKVRSVSHRLLKGPDKTD